MLAKLISMTYPLLVMSLFVLMIALFMFQAARKNSTPIFVQRSYDNLTKYDLDGDIIDRVTSRSSMKIDMRYISQDPDAPAFFRASE